MIFNANRRELLLQVAKVAKASSNTHAIKALAGIHIEANSKSNIVRLTATSMEVSIKAIVPAAVEKDGCAVINAGLLVGMLERLPNDDVYVGMEGSVITLSSGDAKYQVVSMPVDEFPKVEIPMPGSTVTVSGIKTLIRKTAFATGELDARSNNQCVNLVLKPEGITATASNGFCMVQTVGDKDCKGQCSMLVPGKSLKLFASIALDSDVYEMGITGSYGKSIVFYDGTLLFSARIADGTYFDSDKMFAAFSAVTTATMKAEDITNAFVSVRAMEGAGRVGIKFTDSGLELSCQDDEIGGSIFVGADVAISNNQLSHFSISNMSDCLRTLSGKITLAMSKDGHMLLSDSQTRCFLSKMRAPVAKAKPEEVKKTTKKKPSEKKVSTKKAA